MTTLLAGGGTDRPVLEKGRRFAVEKLEDRIAPAGSLLELNLNVLIEDVDITISDVNVVVAGNVIQVGILTGPMSGTVTSLVNVS